MNVAYHLKNQGVNYCHGNHPINTPEANNANVRLIVALHRHHHRIDTCLAVEAETTVTKDETQPVGRKIEYKVTQCLPAVVVAVARLLGGFHN